MEKFEQAMVDENIPTHIIQLIKTSPTWNERIRGYTRTELERLIQLFPIIYHTIIPNPFYSCPEDFERAKKQYVPMDLSD
jgi:hypothetical protein